MLRVESWSIVCFVVKIPPRLENLFDILHEDAGLLVINKPAGLVCHPTKGDEFSSLISRVRLYLKPSTLNLQPSTHLINRLDRETSGIVVVAKNSKLAGELGKIWEARAVEKEYLAIVHGHVRDDHGLIDAPLGKDEQSRSPSKIVCVPTARPPKPNSGSSAVFPDILCRVMVKIDRTKDGSVTAENSPSPPARRGERAGVRWACPRPSTLVSRLSFPFSASFPAPAANIKSAFTSPTSAIPSSATNFTAATRICIWRWSKIA